MTCTRKKSIIADASQMPAAKTCCREEKGMVNMRLFAAVMLSEDMKKTLTAVMHDLKKEGIRGNYVPAQNLHVTMAFIGEFDDVSAVKNVMRELSFNPFRLTLTDMMCVRDILCAGVKGNQGLSGAARQLREAFDAAGIPYDSKKFTPHVTMVKRVSGNWKKISAPKGEMIVEKISLLKSTWKDGKSVYTELTL